MILAIALAAIAAAALGVLMEWAALRYMVAVTPRSRINELAEEARRSLTPWPGHAEAGTTSTCTRALGSGPPDDRRHVTGRRARPGNHTVTTTPSPAPVPRRARPGTATDTPTSPAAALPQHD